MADIIDIELNRLRRENIILKQQNARLKKDIDDVKVLQRKCNSFRF